MTKGAIFDMDGVLVDNRDVHIEAFVALAARYGTLIDNDALLPLFGRGNDEILPGVLPREVIERAGIDALGDEKEAIYREIYAARMVPTPGLLDFARALRADGWRLAVGSSGPKDNVDLVMERCGLVELFDVVVDGGMVSRRKPEPDIFLTCASLLGLEARDCVVFEDSFPGIEAARRAGMKVVALATTFPEERLRSSDYDLLIKDFTRLTPADL